MKKIKKIIEKITNEYDFGIIVGSITGIGVVTTAYVFTKFLNQLFSISSVYLPWIYAALFLFMSIFIFINYARGVFRIFYSISVLLTGVTQFRAMMG